jgi:hypothetical protein
MGESTGIQIFVNSGIIGAPYVVEDPDLIMFQLR